MFFLTNKKIIEKNMKTNSKNAKNKSQILTQNAVKFGI
jgi:ribosomal protein S17E